MDISDFFMSGSAEEMAKDAASDISDDVGLKSLVHEVIEMLLNAQFIVADN